MKNILAICGNTRPGSVNLQLLEWIATRHQATLNFTIYDQIAGLPHFRSDLTGDSAPAEVRAFYNCIEKADAVMICTPEYIFSLPGAIKNALDWTVSTVIFFAKLVALIVASSLGEKAFESLQLIMATLGAVISDQTSLLISSVKTKVDPAGTVHDPALITNIDLIIDRLANIINENNNVKIPANCISRP